MQTTLTCQASVHGTANARKRHGCECDTAARAKYRQDKTTRTRRAREGQLRVDGTGTIRRIRALQRIGYSLRSILVAAGYPNPDATGVLQRMLYDPTRRQVHVDTAARFAAAYDRLWMVDGPDTRARRAAERKGWPPPEAWGDRIDDPDFEPAKRGEGRPKVWDATQLAEVGYLRSWGLSDEEVADRLGVSLEAMRRALQRAAGSVPVQDGRVTVA